jgi:peptidoglycan/LPS O-acetylase OafA/YrhL
MLVKATKERVEDHHPPQLSTHKGFYRPDIDGLRAVAVLSVVAFHTFPSILPGGFVGVDVFFVISGFLISRIILSEQQSGQFSYASFYGRRIRRLFPALLLVLAFSLVAGWVLLFPADYERLGKHLVAASVFLVNFSLLGESGYFDTLSLEGSAPYIPMALDRISQFFRLECISHRS